MNFLNKLYLNQLQNHFFLKGGAAAQLTGQQLEDLQMQMAIAATAATEEEEQNMTPEQLQARREEEARRRREQDIARAVAAADAAAAAAVAADDYDDDDEDDEDDVDTDDEIDFDDLIIDDDDDDDEAVARAADNEAWKLAKLDEELLNCNVLEDDEECALITNEKIHGDPVSLEPIDYNNRNNYFMLNSGYCISRDTYDGMLNAAASARPRLAYVRDPTNRSDINCH